MLIEELNNLSLCTISFPLANQYFIVHIIYGSTYKIEEHLLDLSILQKLLIQNFENTTSSIAKLHVQVKEKDRARLSGCGAAILCAYATSNLDNRRESTLTLERERSG